MKLRMSCKEASEKMDLGVGRLSFLTWLRLELHLLICLACRRYLAMSQALRSVARELVSGKSFDFERLNRELREKFSSPSES